MMQQKANIVIGCIHCDSRRQWEGQTDEVFLVSTSNLVSASDCCGLIELRLPVKEFSNCKMGFVRAVTPVANRGEILDHIGATGEQKKSCIYIVSAWVRWAGITVEQHW